MPIPRVWFTIRRIMVVVAVVAVLIAWLDVVGMIAVAGMILVVLIPVACSAPGHRCGVAGWALSLYPLMTPVYLHLTWIAAWCALGHRPRSSFDDPKYISPLVDVPYVMTYLSSIVWPISIVVGLTFAAFRHSRRSGPNPLPILLAVWSFAFAIIRYDPLNVVGWFLD